MRHRLSATASCPLAVKIVFGLSRSTTTNGQPLGSDLWSVSLLPKHPFVVGNHYDDRNGRYEVLAITGGKVKYRYTDGREKTSGIEIKARIHYNIAGHHRARHPLEPETAWTKIWCLRDYNPYRIRGYRWNPAFQ